MTSPPSAFRGIHAQFFLSFAALGSLAPLLPLYLTQDQGLTDAQLGLVLSVGGLAVLVTPVVLTRLADLGVRSRLLLSLSFLASAAALTGLWLSTGFLLAIALYLLHSLAFQPVMALQDALFFRTRAADPGPRVSYHRVRVWGTIGFIIPSLILYFFVDRVGTAVILPVTVAFAVLGALNARRLPVVGTTASVVSVTETATRPPLVVSAAIRELFSSETRMFAIAMFFVNVAAASLFAFYPLYLTDAVGIEQRWVALVFNVGVVLEVGWMLAFGRIVRRITFRRLLVAGAGAETLRLSLLAAFPTIGVAIATQLLHGLVIIMTSVAPQVLLDGRADNRFRASIQGVYMTLVVGGGRITGSLLAGMVAALGFRSLFALSALVALAATVMLASVKTGEDVGVQET